MAEKSFFQRILDKGILVSDIEHFQHLKPHLLPEEKVLGTVWGNSRPVLFFSSSILVATTNRVIRFAKRWSGYEMISMPYSSIDFIGQEQKSSGFKIMIKFDDGYLLFYPSTRANDQTNLWRVLDVIQQRLGKEETPPSANRSEDPALRLQRLTDLARQGVITAEEYETQRRSLVAQL